MALGAFMLTALALMMLALLTLALMMLALDPGVGAHNFGAHGKTPYLCIHAHT